MINENEMRTMAELLRKLPDEIAPMPPEILRMRGNGNPFHDSGEGKRKVTSLHPIRIVKSGKVTIVFWDDGEKTIVKRSDDEPDSDYAAFTAALAKRVYGSNSKVKSIIRDLTVTQNPKHKRKRQTLEETIRGVGDAFKKLFPNSDGMLKDEKRDEILQRDVDAFWKDWYNAKAAKAADACPIDKPCAEQKAERNSGDRELTLEEKSYLNWEQSDLNDKARAQYEAHKQDMWTCPKCGKAYPWQTGQKGRFAFCFKCNTAGQETAQQ